MGVKHEIRSNLPKTKVATLTPLSAIQAFCKECTGWIRGEVEKCTDPLCPLFPFKLGKDPSREGIGFSKKKH